MQIPTERMKDSSKTENPALPSPRQDRIDKHKRDTQSHCQPNRNRDQLQRNLKAGSIGFGVSLRRLGSEV